MCSLFGVIDFNNSLTKNQLDLTVNTLARVCESRGSDASGIAYNHGGNLRIRHLAALVESEKDLRMAIGGNTATLKHLAKKTARRNMHFKIGRRKPHSAQCVASGRDNLNFRKN